MANLALRGKPGNHKNVLFFISIDRDCYGCQLEGISRFSKPLGWHVQVIENARSAAEVRKAIETWKPIGLIAEYSDAQRFPPSAFGSLPAVYIDIGHRRPPSSISSVALDSAEVGRKGAERLIRLDIPCFAYVRFHVPVVWDAERLEGFSDVVRGAGRELRVFARQSGESAGERQRRLCTWLEALPRPCGIMVCNDRAGEGVLNACAMLGLRVPDDLAVLGVDNDRTICENTSPTLSSVDPCTEQSGFVAAKMLSEQMSGHGGRPTRKLFPPSNIVERASTRRLSCDRSKVASALETIRCRACDGIGVADVVAEMGVSRRAAEKHFRLATGQSILEEINNVRFERVFELLRDPQRQIGAIAGLCGFSTEVALRKAFRLRTGMSMKDWRSQKYR